MKSTSELSRPPCFEAAGGSLWPATAQLRDLNLRPQLAASPFAGLSDGGQSRDRSSLGCRLG